MLSNKKRLSRTQREHCTIWLTGSMPFAVAIERVCTVPSKPATDTQSPACWQPMHFGAASEWSSIRRREQSQPVDAAVTFNRAVRHDILEFCARELVKSIV